MKKQTDFQEHFKTDYEGNPFEKNPVFQKCQAFFMSQPKGELLDIGCSDGEFCSGLVKNGMACHGIDLSSQHIEKARLRGIQAYVMDVSDDLSYATAQFNYIFAGEIIEHLFDTDAFLSECHRVLKKDGLLVLTTPNFTYIRHRIEMLLGQYPVCMWPRFKAHVRIFTHTQIKKDLEKHGFKIEKVMGSYFLFSRARMKYLGRVFEKMADIYPPLLSSQIIMVARKQG